MNIKKIFGVGAIAAFTAVAPGIHAAEAEVKADVDLPKRSDTRLEIDRDRDRDVKLRVDADAAASRDKVEKVHKASGLMGMEVRNNEGEKLGEIKDLVLDVNSGKVSYAVLAVGGFLGIGEKLIALPPNSLKASEDRGHLKLNADKARIQAAPGFAATAWPSLNDAQVNRFWSIDATGAAAGSEIRRGADVDVNLDRDRNRLKGEVDLDRKDRIYTDADDKKVDIEVKKD